MVSTPDFQPLPPRWQSAWRWGALLLTAMALGWLAWDCFFNPEIRFLPPGPGTWIIFPTPPRLEAFPGLELTGTFRRTFALPDQPTSAVVSWRCSTNGELIVNGKVVPRPEVVSSNWKSISQVEVGSLLHPGRNEISVMVVNRLGPPALSLKLRAGDFSLTSDETWEVSVSGSDWRAAQSAYVVPKPGKGNVLDLTETTAKALRRCWPWLCFFAAISSCGVLLLRSYTVRSAPTLTKTYLTLLGALWALLFLHNFPVMPIVAGFDAPDHLAYVNFVQDYRRLPAASAGLEMFQAPLYYVVSAAVLAAGKCHALEPTGSLLLRFLNLAIGAVNLALILAGLRLLFPGDWKKPLAGLTLAAFLPAQIYLLHYTTNETLAAMFVTAALAVALRIIRTERPGWSWYGALGIALGLAMLSKSSAVLALPAIVGVLAVKLILRREKRPWIWLWVTSGPTLICLLMSGWHFLKLWRQYGNPLLGAWDPKVTTPWWEDRGFETLSFFCHFSTCLTRPFFSGLYGFWDGFYSTLWGDGLLGGTSNFWIRPPWNYDFMAMGFLLALIPSALVLTGLVRAGAKCFRAATLPCLLLAGFGWLTALALVDLYLKVPYYAHAKAFFGLSALLPFCALGALGFEYWDRRSKITGNILGVALGVWLINVYASFWIRPHAIQTELTSAIAACSFGKGDSSKAFMNILRDYPGNSEVEVWQATLESKTNPQQAVNRLRPALDRDPANVQIETELARDLGLSGRLDEAVSYVSQAMELAPQSEDACNLCCAMAFLDKNYNKAVFAGRRALDLNPANEEIHFQLGLALMNIHQSQEASQHFSLLVEAQPNWAEAQFELGLCLLDEPGKWNEGLDHLQQAVRLDPSNTAWQTALQKARISRPGPAAH